MIRPNATSVIIAVKDGAAYVGAALESVAAQTLPAFEVLVIDGGSTDGTREIVARYPWATLLPQSGQGLPGAWNEGLRASRGEFIAFLDSDDLWTPGKLRLQADWLLHHQEDEAVTGHVQFFLEEGRPAPPTFRPELLRGTHLAPMPGALLARRRLFDRVGDFDPALAIAADIDWFARVRDLGISIGGMPELVIRKRVHAANLSYVSAQSRAYEGELLRLLRRKVSQARAASHGKG